jgi:hypothetical protein
VFRAILSLQERGSAIDGVTVKDEVKRRGELAKVLSASPDFHGEDAYVAGLLDERSWSRNAADYSRIVLSLRRRREMIARSTALNEALWNGHTDTEVASLLDRVNEVQATADAEDVRLEPLRFTDHRVDEPPPVAFGDAKGDAAFAHGDLILDAGDSGAGKTLALLDLAIAWCTDAAWLGFSSVQAPGGVLVVTSDGDGADPIRARVVRLGAGRGMTAAELDALPLHVVPADGFDLDAPAAFAALKDLLSDLDPGLLILETLASMMGTARDPFNPGSVADFISRRLRPLQLRPDGSRRTVRMSHHLRKRTSTPGSNSLRDRVAGSYRMVGGVDSVIGWEPAGERAFNVKLVKPSRWGLRFRAFHCVIDGDPPGPLTLKATGPLEQTSSEQAADDSRFLDALAALDGPEGWVRLADIKRKAGIDSGDKRASKRAERAGRRLAAAGTVEAHPNRGACYRLPRKGEELPLEDDPE